MNPDGVIRRGSLAGVRRLLKVAFLPVLASCAAATPELETVPHVDLQRFMGDWYVIASIPTFLEKDAYNAVESYALKDDGTIATTFTFRKGSFDGKAREYNPTGFVLEKETNAVWGMQFIWPVKADYRIVYLSSDYSQTVVARNKRDHVWIMARSPMIPEADYRRLVEFVADIGYDVAELRKVPQAARGSRRPDGETGS